MAFAKYLRNEGLLSELDPTDLEGERANEKPRFGTLAYYLGFIDVDQADLVLEQQASRSGLFGEIAVEIGVMTNEQLETVLTVQSTSISTSELVVAARTLDRAIISEYLVLFAFLEPEGISSQQATEIVVEPDARFKVGDLADCCGLAV